MLQNNQQPRYFRLAMINVLLLLFFPLTHNYYTQAQEKPHIPAPPHGLHTRQTLQASPT